MKMPGLNTVIVRYVAVRQADGESEFYDWSTIGGNSAVVQERAWDARAHDSWSEANPVKRVAKIEVREVKA
jgi:hypothetical protein